MSLADLGMLRRRHQEGSPSFSQRPAVACCGLLGGAIRSGPTHWPPQMGRAAGGGGRSKAPKTHAAGLWQAVLASGKDADGSFNTSSPCIPFATPCTTSDFIPTATATDFALTGPIRHGCLERARHKRQHEQGQFAKGGVRPLPRPEAPMHLGSQRAPVPAVCPGKRCVHRPSAAPDGPTPPAVSQCQQQQQQPHPWSEPRSI